MKIRFVWDRPVRAPSGLSEQILMIGFKAEEGTPVLPGNLCLLLDCSGSMNSVEHGVTKLDNAKEACRVAVRCLNPDDLLSLVTYNSRTRAPFEARRRAELTEAFLDDVLGRITAQSVTRIDLALDEAERVLRPHVGPERVSSILLVTDGHPTDPDGRPVGSDAFDQFFQTAQRLAASGISLVTVGLGNPRHFHGPFLMQLADAGQGEFCYAPDARELGKLLEQRVRTAQTTIATGLEILLEPRMPEVQLVDFCRIAPEYRPVEVVGTGPWSVSCGNIATEEALHETAFLARLRVPGRFGMETGSFALLQLNASWQAKHGARVSAPPIDVTIEYSTRVSDYQVVNPRVERLRERWEVNRCQDELHHSTSAAKTQDLLGQIAKTAGRLGMDDVSDEVQEQLKEFQASGSLDPDRTIRIGQDLRSADRAAAEGEGDDQPGSAPAALTGFGDVGPSQTQSPPTPHAAHPEQSGPPAVSSGGFGASFGAVADGEQSVASAASQVRADSGEGLPSGFGGARPQDRDESSAPRGTAAPEMTIDSAVLIVVDGQTPGEQFRLDRVRMVVGRHDPPDHLVDVDLTDQQSPDVPAVSRRHAEFTWVSGRLRLRDLGSANGTSVNGVPLQPGDPDRPAERREVRAGDVIRFANITLRVDVT